MRILRKPTLQKLPDCVIPAKQRPQAALRSVKKGLQVIYGIKYDQNTGGTTIRLYRESTERSGSDTWTADAPAEPPYGSTERALKGWSGTSGFGYTPGTTIRLYRESTESITSATNSIVSPWEPPYGSTERALKGQRGLCVAERIRGTTIRLYRESTERGNRRVWQSGQRSEPPYGSTERALKGETGGYGNQGSVRNHHTALQREH